MANCDSRDHRIHLDRGCRVFHIHRGTTPRRHDADDYRGMCIPLPCGPSYIHDRQGPALTTREAAEDSMILLLFVASVLVSVLLERQARQHTLERTMEYERLGIPIPPPRPKLKRTEAWLN